MRIALDVDGVLADLITTLLTVYEEETGIKIRPEEVDSWDFWRRYNISRQQFIQLLIKTWDRWRDIQPTENDLAEDVEELNRLGHIDIVTQRPAKTINNVKKWLAHHGIKYRNFTWVPPKSTKAILNYHVFIDDSPKLAEELIKLGKSMLLYNQPWNKTIKETKTLKRVSSLDDCIKILNENKLV